MKDDAPILKVEELSIQKSGQTLLHPLSFQLYPGDNLAITGAAGSGKSLLAQALAGRQFHFGTINYSPSIKNIAWIEQQHHFKNRSNTSSFYYQQRFNSFDADDSGTVEEYLGSVSPQTRNMLAKMGIEYLLSKPLIQLSNGENKKVQLALAMLENPDAFIMDQPFVGLDAPTRVYLHELINKLSAKGVLIILVTQPNELPVCMSRVVTLKQGELGVVENRSDFDKRVAQQPASHKDVDEAKLKKVMGDQNLNGDGVVIDIQQVNVRYGDKEILSDVDWKIMRGERWLLTGPNGAGKSTLLSLITADNPQAYSNSIYLFGRKRGSGETIWDIKQKIGYLSPELHQYFDNTCSCFEAVASGLFDTIGLFRQLTQEQIELVTEWINFAELNHLTRKGLYEISLGEQRKVLLIRALVKNPPLLILDEPCQGLDDETEAELLDLINKICLIGNKTMIFVTHYADKRPACVNHFMRLEKGRRVES